MFLHRLPSYIPFISTCHALMVAGARRLGIDTRVQRAIQKNFHKPYFTFPDKNEYSAKRLAVQSIPVLGNICLIFSDLKDYLFPQTVPQTPIKSRQGGRTELRSILSSKARQRLNSEFTDEGGAPRNVTFEEISSQEESLPEEDILNRPVKPKVINLNEKHIDLIIPMIIDRIPPLMDKITELMENDQCLDEYNRVSDAEAANILRKYLRKIAQDSTFIAGIEELDLRGDKLDTDGNYHTFTYFPTEFYFLTGAKKINLNYSEFPSIPDFVFESSELTELSIDYNSLEEISDKIGKLKKLKVLSLRYSGKLTSLPPALSQLENLEELRLGYSKKIKTLENIKLKGLKGIEIDGTNLMIPAAWN